MFLFGNLILGLVEFGVGLELGVDDVNLVWLIELLVGLLVVVVVCQFIEYVQGDIDLIMWLKDVGVVFNV